MKELESIFHICFTYENIQFSAALTREKGFQDSATEFPP